MLSVGCANRLVTTTAPQFQNKTVVVNKIGVTGAGASVAAQAFLEEGYSVVDLGNGAVSALKQAKEDSIPFMATIEPVGTDGSWWDGFFDFAMRVTEIITGSIVWSAQAEYGQGGLFINQTESTKAAMRDMVRDFKKHFPPK